MNILISGGGSGGHIYPGLAIAESLPTEDKIIFVLGRKKIDKTIGEKIDLKNVKKSYILSEGFNSKISLKNIKSWFSFIRLCFKIIISTVYVCYLLIINRVDRVLATGGYVCIPVIFASKILRKKLFFHEQNAVLGLTGKVAKKMNATILYTWDNGSDKVVGCPVRNNLKDIAKANSYNVNSDYVLIFGGSQGAKEINDVISENIDTILEKSKLNIIHVCGELAYDIFKNKSSDRYIVKKYSHNLLELISKAKFVICRSGATTCVELLSLKIPALLFPLKTAANNEQTKNGEILEKLGLGIIVNKETFLENFFLLISDEKRLVNMSNVIESKNMLLANDTIVDIIRN